MDTEKDDNEEDSRLVQNIIAAIWSVQQFRKSLA